MSSDNAIKVENLSKCYQIYVQPRDRLKQFILPRLQSMVGQPPGQYFREFWALKDVSFEVKKGETVGIVGRNGSGKSTLLQMICGTLNPTSGSIKTSGRIAALLELGSGFNPEFTGKENVYLNATILGLSKEEIDNRLDKILTFADIGEFVDQPVNTYSSGMMLRLAFAVQTQVDPDILIVDEALAVGDAKFQAKCFERLRQLQQGGASILLVTHSCEQIVAHTSRAILIDGGAIISQGEPRLVVNQYLDLLFGKDPQNLVVPSLSSKIVEHNHHIMTNGVDDIFASRAGYNHHEYRWGDGSAKILDFYLESEGHSYPSQIESGKFINLSFSVRFYESIMQPIFGITIKTKEGITVYGANSETLETEKPYSMGERGAVALAKFFFVCSLAPGDYFVSTGVASRLGGEVVPHDRRYDSIHLQVTSKSIFFGLANLDMKLKIC